jgi:hypothetical protein
MWGLAVACGTSLCAGCYQYVPVELDQVPAGAAVRAQLSAGALDRLRSRMEADGGGGLLRSTTLDARLVARDPQRALLSIPWVRTGDIYSSNVLRQEVDLPWSDILEMRLKRLDRKKTGGLAAALAVVVGLTTYQVLTGWTGGPTSPPGDPGPVEARIPLYRLRFSR